MFSYELLFSFLDVVQLVVGLVDVCSDVAVIADFRQQALANAAAVAAADELLLQNITTASTATTTTVENPYANLFFWITLLLFIAGSVIETGMFMISVEHRKSPFWIKHLTDFAKSSIPQLIFEVIVLSFFSALFAPAANFILANFFPDENPEKTRRGQLSARQRSSPVGPVTMKAQNGRDENEIDSSGKTEEDGEGEAARMMLNLGANQFSLDSDLDAALLRRRVTMMLSNVSAVAGSLPQCVVQLIAISISNRPTDTQIFSLLLSLFSLCLHVPQVCRSFRTSAFCAKFFFVSSDILSFSFIASTLFSVNFAGGDLISSFYLTFVFCCLGFIAFFGGIFILIEVERAGRWPWRDMESLLIWTAAILIICGFFAPVVILALGIRFGWYVMLCQAFRDEALAGSKEISALYEWLFAPKRALHKNRHTGQMIDWEATFKAVEKFVQGEYETLKEWKARSSAKFMARSDEVAALHQAKNPVVAKWAQYTRTSNTGRALISKQDVKIFHSRLRKVYADEDYDITSNEQQQQQQPQPPLDQQPLQHLMMKTVDNPVEELEQLLEDEKEKRRAATELAAAQRKLVQEEPDGFLARLRFAVLVNRCRLVLNLRITTMHRLATHWSTSPPPALGQRMRQAGATIPTTFPAAPNTRDTFESERFAPIKNEPLTFWKLFVMMFDLHGVDFARGFKKMRNDISNASTETRLRGGALAAVFGLFVLTVLVGTFFVPLHFLWHGIIHGSLERYNSLQQVLLVGSLASLVFSLFFVPASVRYVFILYLVEGSNGPNVSLNTVKDIFDDFNSVPVSFLMRSVSDAAVPQDALEQHVLAFLSSRSLGLHGMSDAEFETLFNSKT